MSRRKGYLLLENIITTVVIVILTGLLYYLLFFTYNISIKLEDKVELQQQANEMSKYIDKVIGDSKGIFGYKVDNEGQDKEGFTSVVSIKCKYRDSISDNKIKDKEISLKKNTDKLFINTLRSNGSSESGGYEIGDYIDNMYISKDLNSQIINIRLELSKNDEKLSSEFSINIRNFEGENI